jgi:hypothetical protein
MVIKNAKGDPMSAVASLVVLTSHMVKCPESTSQAQDHLNCNT